MQGAVPLHTLTTTTTAPMSIFLTSALFSQIWNMEKENTICLQTPRHKFIVSLSFHPIIRNRNLLHIQAHAAVAEGILH